VIYGEEFVNKFIFDVDGTLTPSRRAIDKQFAVWFRSFCKTNNVYLVTGSDRDKTIEQIGETLYNSCKRVYNCSGNDVWEQDRNIRTSDWKLPEDAEKWLRDKLNASNFPLRTGLHIENRPGMINFSVVGRNATLGERKLYVEHDTTIDERHTIARLFEEKFPGIQAVVGGDTGIDIYPIGSDKSQILNDFTDEDFIYFFGDMCQPGGNDFPVANALREGVRMGVGINVDGWKDTWSKLNAYNANGT
tara:strand:+ start:783 stop:1523 length:741 start_codon:yes stop_codon:yes gene_type:complete